MDIASGRMDSEGNQRLYECQRKNCNEAQEPNQTLLLPWQIPSRCDGIAFVNRFNRRLWLRISVTHRAHEVVVSISSVIKRRR